METGPRAPRWRRVLVALLVVLGCILAPLSMFGVWLKAELLDTDTYVSTMAPLADNPHVQNAIADRITNALVVDTSIEQRVEDGLPGPAQFLAPKLTDAFASVVHDAALKLVESERFSVLWEGANRRAHASVVAVLEGKDTERLAIEDGQITLDLGPIARQVNAALEERGIDVFANSDRVQDNQVVLVDSIWIERAQTWTDLLQRIAFVLPILTLLCFGVAIWLSPNRRRTMLRGALGVALALAVVAVGINAGRHFYLSALPDSVNTTAAGSVYDTLVEDLRLGLRTGFVLALVVALGAWLSGPARPAGRIRSGVLGLVRRAPGDDTEVSAVAAFVGRHRRGLRGLVIGVGLAVLVALSSPSPTAVLVIAVLVVLGILLIEFLGRTAPPIDPDSPEPQQPTEEPRVEEPARG